MLAPSVHHIAISGGDAHPTSYPDHTLAPELPIPIPARIHRSAKTSNRPREAAHPIDTRKRIEEWRLNEVRTAPKKRVRRILPKPKEIDTRVTINHGQPEPCPMMDVFRDPLGDVTHRERAQLNAGLIHPPTVKIEPREVTIKEEYDENAYTL
jgi:hypothetical protein